MTTNFESQNREAVINLAKGIAKTRYPPAELKQVPVMLGVAFERQYQNFGMLTEEELKVCLAVFTQVIHYNSDVFQTVRNCLPTEVRERFETALKSMLTLAKNGQEEGDYSVPSAGLMAAYALLKDELNA